MVRSVIIRSTSGFSEPRFRAGLNLLSNLSGQVSTITWNRTNDEISNMPKKMDYILRLHAGYGKGLRNTFSHFRFFIYVLRRLSEIHPTLIYACDFDTLLPAVLWKRNRKVTIVFDQFDPISTRIGGLFYFKITTVLEAFLSKKADFRITANKQRIDSLNRSEWREIKNIYPITQIHKKLKATRENRVLFYGGILANDRGLLPCAQAIAVSTGWEFHIYGQGAENEALRNLGFPNVFINEPLPHPDLMDSAVGSDLYLALYDPSKFHNKFTASNKLFEAAQMGIPILASVNTELGDIVENFNLGFTVEYGNIPSIEMALREFGSIDFSRLHQIKDNLHEYYRNQLELNQQNWNNFVEDLKNVMEIK